MEAWPRVDAATLVPPECRAVVVAPHPDDEVLGCAGLMMQLAALDRELLLIGVTDGTGSHPGSRQWPPQRLAKVRPRESAQAMQRLGLGRVPVIRAGIADTRVEMERTQLASLLKARLRANDVLLTTWRQDGHPDHEATGRTCAEVAERKGCTLIELPIWTWHWSAPGDSRVPWHRARRIPLSQIQQEAKRAAIGAHASQLSPDTTTGQGAILTPATLARLLRPFEVVFL
ncbi:PIG-L family deacetylase [Pistricoccus aurantiacus]|uniref:PIG-L family deacetylase n=2 Tax=Pistricoccus aurantiacus TaxID=1883414 RepID=A0A5B8SV26_9GAMM|nr:PIG-L family deacetylase [Pistricoccus aurantiacus]